ncbi:MAG: hypothetical protein KDD64_04050 [Bdellovibrionales bacterium]|nr:hypothetical protein [Bdellovibrionales bacterium]
MIAKRLKTHTHTPLVFIFLFSLPSLVSATPPEIVAARVTCLSEKECTASITLRHSDTGWEHYANRWDIFSPKGELLGTRILRHPHVEEQPFTRTLEKFKIPQVLQEVTIVAFDTGGAQSAPFRVNVRWDKSLLPLQ